MLGAALAHHHDLPGRLRFILFGVVELAVRGLMDSGGNGLHLAHSFPEGDPLLLGGKNSRPCSQPLAQLDGDRGGAPHRLQERLIVRHRPGQAGGQLRQRLSVRLRNIKHLHRAEHGDFDSFSSMTALPSASRMAHGCPGRASFPRSSFCRA